MKSQPRIAAAQAHGEVPRSTGLLANSRRPEVIAAQVVEVTSAVEATALTARPAWTLRQAGLGRRATGTAGP